MNNVKCNICESLSIDNFLKKGNYEIVRCNNCGLAFVKNIPSDADLNNLYTDSFFIDGQKSPLDGFNIKENPTYLNALMRLENIKRIGYDKGQLLDIGCATGIFLKAASSFFDCTGLDVSEYATEFARKNLGINALCGNIFDINFKSQSFDIVTMWDVIEHVRDPNRYIEKVGQIMKHGGLLVLSTGNIESLMFRIQRQNWHLLIPPLHLYYFSKNSISSLLRRHGFKIINISHNGQYTNIGYIFNKLKRLHKSSRAADFSDSIIKRLSLNKLNIYLNLYDVMTVYAIRDF